MAGVKGLKVRDAATLLTVIHWMDRGVAAVALQECSKQFLKVLGKMQSEAVMRYGREHERIEHLISLAKNGVRGLSSLEQSIRLTMTCVPSSLHA